MKPMRRVAVAFAGLVAASLPAAAAHAEDVVSNATELYRALRPAIPAAGLVPLMAVQGCGPAGCNVVLGGVKIDTDAGTLRSAAGRPIRWAVAEPAGVANLPEVNWAPLRGFGVRRAGKPWGHCLEFGHAGLENSGLAQRRRTVVLVPAAGRSAYRFIGYWAGCEALAQGPATAEILLPIVEAATPGVAALHIVWNRCTPRRCTREHDSRVVNGDANGEDGRLMIR